MAHVRNGFEDMFRKQHDSGADYTIAMVSKLMIMGSRDVVWYKGNLPIFSNPRMHDERCGKKKTCGDPAIGDAARALNENAHYFASHKAQPNHAPPRAIH